MAQDDKNNPSTDEGFDELPVDAGTEDLPTNEGEIAWSDDDNDLKAQPPGDDFDDPNAGSEAEADPQANKNNRAGRGFASTAEDSLKPPRSNLATILSVVLAVLLIGGGGLWFFTSRDTGLKPVIQQDRAQQAANNAASLEKVETVDTKTASAMFDQPTPTQPSPENAPPAHTTDQPVLSQSLEESRAPIVPDPAEVSATDVPPAALAEPNKGAPAEIQPTQETIPPVPAATVPIPVEKAAAPEKPGNRLEDQANDLKETPRPMASSQEMAQLTQSLSDLKNQMASVKEQLNSVPPAPPVTSPNAAEIDRLAKLETRIEQLTQTVAALSTAKAGIEVSSRVPEDEVGVAPKKSKPVKKTKKTTKKTKAPQKQVEEDLPEITGVDRKSADRTQYVLSRRSTGGPGVVPRPVQSTTVLRAAMPGVAWLSSDRSSTAVQMIQVGETHPVIGKIRSIKQVGSVWVIEGTRGTIKGSR